MEQTNQIQKILEIFKKYGIITEVNPEDAQTILDEVKKLYSEPEFHDATTGAGVSAITTTMSKLLKSPKLFVMYDWWFDDEWILPQVGDIIGKEFIWDEAESLGTRYCVLLDGEKRAYQVVNKQFGDPADFSKRVDVYTGMQVVNKILDELETDMQVVPIYDGGDEDFAVYVAINKSDVEQLYNELKEVMALKPRTRNIEALRI